MFNMCTLQHLLVLFESTPWCSVGCDEGRRTLGGPARRRDAALVQLVLVLHVSRRMIPVFGFICVAHRGSYMA